MVGTDIAASVGAEVTAIESQAAATTGLADDLGNVLGEEAVNTADATNSVTTPPNPNGKNGGPAHQAVIGDIEQDITDRGLHPQREYRFDTTGGNKNTRYADVVALDDDGNVVEIHQAGRSTKAGEPISRERKAIEDIEGATDIDVTYHPYDRSE